MAHDTVERWAHGQLDAKWRVLELQHSSPVERDDAIQAVAKRDSGEKFVIISKDDFDKVCR